MIGLTDTLLLHDECFLVLLGHGLDSAARDSGLVVNLDDRTATHLDVLTRMKIFS